LRIAYFDCFAGASGDMILAALVDAGVPLDALQVELEKVPVKGYRMDVSRVTRRGIASTRLEVIDEVEGSYPPQQMIALIKESALSPTTAQTAIAIIERLVAAEAKVHGVPQEEVHFHELSSLDTLLDAVGAAAGLELLKVEAVYVSAVNVGGGMVRGDHGFLPVPAPATLELLRGVPCFSRGEHEATTPTGAAILTSIGRRFGLWPTFSPEAVGYGAGARDSENPNVLRLIVGSSTDLVAEEALIVLETNIDDMNPQFYEHVGESLLSHGAIDFFVTPVLMKKGRPGQLLTVLTSMDRLDEVVATLFEETTTLGVRISEAQRVRLKREERVIDSALGPCRLKIAFYRGRVVNIAPEYEDCRQLARAHNLPLKEVYARVLASALERISNAAAPL